MTDKLLRLWSWAQLSLRSIIFDRRHCKRTQTNFEVTVRTSWIILNCAVHLNEGKSNLYFHMRGNNYPMYHVHIDIQISYPFFPTKIKRSHDNEFLVHRRVISVGFHRRHRSWPVRRLKSQLIFAFLLFLGAFAFLLQSRGAPLAVGEGEDEEVQDQFEHLEHHGDRDAQVKGQRAANRRYHRRITPLLM